MLRQPPLQVRRVTDVKPIVFRGMQQVDVKTFPYANLDSCVRRSLLRGFELCECSESIIIARLTAEPMTFFAQFPVPPSRHVVAFQRRWEPRRRRTRRAVVLTKADTRCAARTFVQCE